MELDHTTCERARRARDPRYDGRFFVAVLSTGVFCRPTCPAPLAKPENVRFYPSAAAASRAGYRPCLRCRPEAAPGNPLGDGQARVVRRALALIREGALNQGDVGRLARMVGLEQRQLRRLFKKYLGSSPLAVGNLHRVFFVKKLLTETTLSITEIALASGFGSIRQCNEVFRKVYGCSPRDIRRQRDQGRKPLEFAERLHLDFRPPYAWELVSAFLAERAVPGVEVWRNGTYSRTIRLGQARGWISVAPDQGRDRLTLEISLDRLESLAPAVERVRRLFDLDANPQAIHQVLSGDDTLGPLAKRQPGVRLPGAWDFFECAVRAVLGERLGASEDAAVMAAGLARKCGPYLETAAPVGLERFFPSPEDLIGADLDEAGLPPKKTRVLTNMLAAIDQQGRHPDMGEDLDAFVRAFSDLSGMDPWTGHYLAMRGLGHPDAFPAGDPAIIDSLSVYGGRPNPEQALSLARGWSPWRAYGGMLLWHENSKTKVE